MYYIVVVTLPSATAFLVASFYAILQVKSSDPCQGNFSSCLAITDEKCWSFLHSMLNHCIIKKNFY